VIRSGFTLTIGRPTLRFCQWKERKSAIKVATTLVRRKQTPQFIVKANYVSAPMTIRAMPLDIGGRPDFRGEGLENLPRAPAGMIPERAIDLPPPADIPAEAPV
jgi:hypothetical protein